MMKKYLFTLILLLCSLIVSAQEQVNIRLKTIEGQDSTITLFVSQVGSIFFDYHYDDYPEGFQIIDLGLPSGTKWASVNYYTEDENGVRDSLKQWSDKDHDYVTADWGTRFKDPTTGELAQWRMPTQMDFEELLNPDNCVWTFNEGLNGYIIQSKKEEFKDQLFLPIDMFDQGVAVGHYWLSTKSSLGFETGKVYQFYRAPGSVGRNLLENKLYYEKYYVRPVLGKPLPTVTVDVNCGNRTSTSLSFTMSVVNPDKVAETGRGIEYRTIGNGNWTAISLTGSSTTVTGLAAGTTYEYRAYVTLSDRQDPVYSEAKTAQTESNTLTVNSYVAPTDTAYNKVTFTIQLTADDLSAFNIMSCGVYVSTNRLDVTNHDNNYRYLASAQPDVTGKCIVEFDNNVQPLTTYYYCAFVQYGFNNFVYSPDLLTVTTPRKTARKVNLGLSVMWADVNIGAETTSDYGVLYGWGDTEGKKDMNNSLYGPREHYTSIAGDERYDVATAMWGTGWHIPDTTQIRELVEKCDWSKPLTYNGHQGFWIKGRGTHRNDSIFLPLSGYREGTKTEQEGDTPFYWSSQTGPRTSHAYGAVLKYPGLIIAEYDRRLGMAIRPVYDDRDPEPEPEKDLSTEVAETTTEGGDIPKGGLDMGLSVRWARWNLGGKALQTGKYYAWGENNTKESYTYSSYTSNYKSVDGRTIGVLDGIHDAAHTLWQGNWRMPTAEEVEELLNSCKKEWYVDPRTGKSYLKLTSIQNDSTLLFPVGGYQSGTLLEKEGTTGSYWTASYYETSNREKRQSQSSYLEFYQDASKPDGISTSVAGTERFLGLLIRPVWHTYVTSIRNDEGTTTLTKGKNSRFQLFFTVLPENATNREVETIVDDSNIVNQFGTNYFEAINEGSTTITVMTKDKGPDGNSPQELSFTVNVVFIHVTGIDPIPGLPRSSSGENTWEWGNVNSGDTFELSYTVKPSNATNPDVSFEVENEDVVKHIGGNTFQAVSEGQTQIRIISEDNGKMLTYNVSVVNNN